MNEDLAVLRGLQDWYKARCDGRWEHSYGISISTLDNPGWAVRIDLADTYLANRRFDPISIGGANDADWYDCRVVEQVFEAFCGPNKLVDVVDAFLQWTK